MTTITVAISDLKPGDTFRLHPGSPLYTVVAVTPKPLYVDILAKDGLTYRERPERIVEIIPRTRRDRPVMAEENMR